MNGWASGAGLGVSLVALAALPGPAAGAAFEFPPAASVQGLSYELIIDGEVVPALPPELAQTFPEVYAEVPGVVTFRGGSTRTSPSHGSRSITAGALSVSWMARTGRGGKRWGGGAGWTGQPAIVAWPEAARAQMKTLLPWTRDRHLIEVIQGSLDGKVYFLDLETGRPTRRPLETGNPIKGSVAVDPRGYPLLYVGQGIKGRRPLGFRIYSLVDGTELFFLPGKDEAAPRRWGAFDSAGLLNRDTDSYMVAGENGLLYLLKLNTRLSADGVSVSPRTVRYRFRRQGAERAGIESSVTAVRNLAFFADNAGTIQALDLRTFSPLWAVDAGDDTDATLTAELEEGAPVLYTGSEVDLQGEHGKARLRKLSGGSGQVLWEREMACGSLREPRKTDGGALATNLVGQGDIADRVIFTLARCPGLRGGMVLALDKRDGRELWSRPLPRYAWSSPVDVASSDGHTYLLQADIAGTLRLIDARTGDVRAALKLRGLVEASPAVYDDRVVIVTRAGFIYGLTLR